MSLIAYLLIAFGGAGLGLFLRHRPLPSAVIGIAALVAATVAAVAIDPSTTLVVGGTTLVATTYARLFLILGSVGALLLSIVALAARPSRDIAGLALGSLGAIALTLTLRDPRIAVMASTAGALFAVLLPVRGPDRRAGAVAGLRALRAAVIAGAMAVAATAWIARDLSQLAAQPVVFGLAYLAFALAVALRFGSIPFHTWAARLTDAIPESALPVVTTWGPAAFAIVALAWIDESIAPLLVEMDAERNVVLVIAVATILLGAFAATIQDDIEHVVGYSIVGDCGVVLLALAALDPTVWAPARTWILTFVLARTAFAAWAGAVRLTFGTGRIDELRGWAIRAPALGVGFVAIVVATLGLPGLTVFEARAALAGVVFDGPLRTLMIVIMLAPIAACARLALVGLRRPGPTVAAADRWPGMPRRPDVDLTAPRASALRLWADDRPAAAVGASLVAALLAVVVALGGLGVPEAAGGVGPGIEGPAATGVPEGPGAGPSGVPGSGEPGSGEPSVSGEPGSSASGVPSASASSGGATGGPSASSSGSEASGSSSSSPSSSGSEAPSASGSASSGP